MNDESEDFKSKSQVKRELGALTDFAAELTVAGHQRVQSLGFPEAVLKAIAEGERIKAHGGRKRQIKFIGKLLRDVDPDIIERARTNLGSEGLEEKQREKRISDLRDRLIAEGDAALGEALEHYPTADRQALRALMRKARNEADQGKNLGGAKALLRELRRLDMESADSDED